MKITETAADVKIGFLKNFAIFTGKHLCWSLFSVRLQHRRLLVNIGKFLRTPFFTDHLWWLLLKLCSILFIFNKGPAKLKIFNLLDELIQSTPHFIQIGKQTKHILL